MLENTSQLKDSNQGALNQDFMDSDKGLNMGKGCDQYVTEAPSVPTIPAGYVTQSCAIMKSTPWMTTSTKLEMESGIDPSESCTPNSTSSANTGSPTHGGTDGRDLLTPEQQCLLQDLWPRYITRTSSCSLT